MRVEDDAGDPAPGQVIADRQACLAGADDHHLAPLDSRDPAWNIASSTSFMGLTSG